MSTRSLPWRCCRSVVACALAAALVACASDDPPQWEPISAEDTRQLFVFSRVNGSGYDGHGFILDRGAQQPLGVTSYQVAATIAGSPIDPGPPESDAWLRTVVDSTVLVRLGQRFAIPDAHTSTSVDTQHDVAAYTVIDFLPERALTLADAPPAAGDTVYILALQLGNSPLDGPRRHPARVVVSSDAELRYAYLISTSTFLTSGAAVLDRDGRVVGLNVASAEIGPRVHGFAVTLASLRALLPD